VEVKYKGGLPNSWKEVEGQGGLISQGRYTICLDFVYYFEYVYKTMQNYFLIKNFPVYYNLDKIT